ncbi:MAG: chemotaxis protein CheD [Treponema sp.]|nr:MAG: Chemoreceptor glutamine deamidase CheD [Spirochaetes bacterium ADurb.Bin269]TAH55658.1 MAG: chemotaxis protein CheD [Treponema sp.]
MNSEQPDLLHLPKIVVHPGEQAVTAEPSLITTLLGSCIAVCLYDPVNKVAGMNHFLLANRRYAKDIPMPISEAGRYGINAMELLINALLKKGAERKYFKAKVFGGAAVIQLDVQDNFMCVGDVNARFIKEFLNTEKIATESMDIGGTQGRVIKFRTDTYAVYRRFIKNTAEVALEKNEHSFWQNKLEENKKSESGTIFLFN